MAFVIDSGPIQTTWLKIGQRVREAEENDTGKAGVVCETDRFGYIVIFEDGSSTCDAQRYKWTRIEGPLATPEEIERLKCVHTDLEEATRRRWEAEERQRDGETQRLTTELAARYPWAIAPDAKMGGKKITKHARAAKNLRLELAKVFPSISSL